MIRGRKRFRMFVAGLLVMSMALPVHASSVEERKQQVNEIESQKNQAEAEAAALAAQLNEILAEMDQTQMDIENKENEIAQKEDELMYAQIDENNQYMSMKKRIKYMYENGNTQFIEILFESKSIGDFLNNAEYISQISEYDRDMLIEFQEIVKEVERQQAELEKEKEELIVLQDKLIEEQEMVNALLENKNLEISSLEAQLGANAARLQQLEAAAAEALRLQREAEAAEAAAKEAEQNRNNGVSSPSGAGPSYVPIGNSTLSNPCPTARISSEYGRRSSPGGIGSTNHKGRDYAAATGTPIYAAADGTVTTVGYNRARGNYLVVNHGNGLATLYQHCSAIYAYRGQSVKRGQNIAAVGSTGASTGPHLHFEVHVNGVPVDPRTYL